ncbi:transcriptional regulator [Halobacteriales archaeon QS_1_67_19]|nr:MAG: transcriptional regulator [Halobacteriales archaeon QS_1_67_19]
MGERTPSTEVERLTPEEAFLLFADETRVDILRVLGEAWADEWPGLLSYAELMDRVDATDSGRFNYHLQRLVGQFVRHREERYKLNYRGLLVYRSIVAGTFTEDVTVDPFELDATCHDCGAPLRASQQRDIFVIRCSDADCACKYVSTHLPPRGFHDRTREELLRAIDQRTRQQLSLFSSGICPWCAGTASGSVGSRDDSWNNHTLEFDVTFACDHCGGFVEAAVGRLLTVHHEVVSLYADRGIDLTTTPGWELTFAVTDYRTEVLSEDPLRLGVTVGPDESHRAVVTADGSVAAVRER